MLELIAVALLVAVSVVACVIGAKAVMRAVTIERSLREEYDLRESRLRAEYDLREYNLRRTCESIECDLLNRLMARTVQEYKSVTNAHLDHVEQMARIAAKSRGAMVMPEDAPEPDGIVGLNVQL